MINTFLENELYRGLYHTFILMIIISFLSIITYFLLSKGFKISTSENRLKRRITYISSILFVFFCAKIWVQGFTQVFYGLSLVSAGLVVTNKESIMNLVGWGIISWRGLFAEGDFIEISGHSGVVYELGILYFKILEASSISATRSTGKFIKIPNGIVINNIIKQHSPERHYIEYQVQFLTPISKDIKVLMTQITEILNEVLPQWQYQIPKYKKNKEAIALIKNHVYQPPLVDMTFSMDKPNHLIVSMNYHCLSKEKFKLEKLIKERLLRELIPINCENTHTA